MGHLIVTYQSIHICDANLAKMEQNSNQLWGGEGGIRTHGRRKPSEVFKTSAFDHSATSPMMSGRPYGSISLRGGSSERQR